MAALFADVSPLRHSRDFRRLWAGQTISAMGSQLTLVALAYQTFHLTHSTLMVGLLGFVGLVPLLAGALWGGTLADAWDRRRVLTLTQFAMAIAVAGLAVNASLDHPEVWVLFVCAAASAGFQGMDWPARRAALPMLVSDDDVTAAVTLQTTTMALSMVVGPALGGVLIARLGLTPVYLIDVATYAVSLTVVRLLPSLVPSGGGTPMGLRSMTEGFRHLTSERLLSATYLIDLNAMIFGMPRAVFPALAVHLYGGGAGVVGLLYAAPGAGALVGSLVTGWTARIRHQGRAIAACVVVWGGTIAIFGVVPVLWVGLALLAVAGARGRDLRRLPPERAAAGRARPPPGAAVGHVLRRRGRWAAPGRPRDRHRRRHRRTRVRRLVGRAGLRRRRRDPAVARARTVGRRRWWPTGQRRRPRGGRGRGHHRAQRG